MSDFADFVRAQGIPIVLPLRRGPLWTMPEGRAWKLVSSFDFVNENIGGALAVIGMLIGSTTIEGCVFQLGASACWFTMIVRRGTWGLVPFNIGLVVVALVNIWRAW